MSMFCWYYALNTFRKMKSFVFTGFFKNKKQVLLVTHIALNNKMSEEQRRNELM